MSNIMDFWRNEWKKVTDTSELFGNNKNTREQTGSSSNDPVAQKLNSFASSQRNVLARMYSKSVLTNNTQEDLDDGIPLKEVKEYSHHFIKTKGEGFREYIANGEYYSPSKGKKYPQVIIMAYTYRYEYIVHNYVEKGEKYEIEVHTHPTFDPLIDNYERNRNLTPSPTDMIYMPKVKDFISFVEAESMQFALVVKNTNKAKRHFNESKLNSLNNEFDLSLTNKKDEESYSEASIKAAKSILGSVKEKGIAFYVNWDKSNPNFTLQN